MNANSKSCPSAPLYKGSKLLGVVNDSGEVDILPRSLEITDEFVRIATEAGDVEKRFRFTNKCVKSACSQWSDKGCAVALRAVHKIESQHWKTALTTCDIRSTCRWFDQEGANACRTCELVRYRY